MIPTFSWNTKQLRSATHCCDVRSLNAPLNIISVNSSSSALKKTGRYDKNKDLKLLFCQNNTKTKLAVGFKRCTKQKWTQFISNPISQDIVCLKATYFELFAPPVFNQNCLSDNFKEMSYQHLAFRRKGKCSDKINRRICF